LEGYAARGMIFLAGWLLLCWLVLLSAPAIAQTASTQTASGVVVHLQPCVTRQMPGDQPARLFADASRFDCGVNTATLGPGSWWVRLNLPAQGTAPAAADDSPNLFRFAPAWQRTITLYTRDRAGNVVGRQFADADLSRLLSIGGAITLPLAVHSEQESDAAPVTQILLRIDGALNASGLLGDPAMMGMRAAHSSDLVATAIFAAFAGLGIGLFCYNFVLWLTIRERFQLTYCLSLLAMLAYVWSSSGAMAVQFPFIPQAVRIQTSYVMLAFVAALAMQFITDFIETDKLPPALRFVARHVGVGSMAAALLVVVAPEGWRFLADRFYVATFLPLPPLVIAVTTVAWSRGSASVKVLAIAWTVPLGMALVRIAHALHLVSYGLIVQYALVAAMSIEALLSSLAMSFRIKLITDERDRALVDERAARHLASVDSLTGLLNRRALLAQVIEWESPEPLRLLLVDIDHFKQINDRHGHLMGDEVLVQVAEILAMRTELRGSVARMGGEEFALIGTAAELHEGIALAILSDMRGRTMAGAVRLTVSIGMAEGMVRSEDEWRELYRRADAALYRAKSAGRNRAIHAGAHDSDLPALPTLSGATAVA
jgi:diguanylate cyclase (GGDEF)-like protein